MKIQLKNIPQQSIIILDSEYDSRNLIQLAFLVLDKVEPQIFEIKESFNIYLNSDLPVSLFFRKYTNISDDFLNTNGIAAEEAKQQIEEILGELDPAATLIVGHDIKNDLSILKENNIDFTQFSNYYCTYQMAKKLLNQKSNLNLKSLAANGCYYSFNEHNAYADIWATLAAFCWLNKVENETKEKTNG